jgi:hypothetical protein
MNSLRRLLAEVPQLEAKLGEWAGGSSIATAGTGNPAASVTQLPSSPGHGAPSSFQWVFVECGRWNVVIHERDWGVEEGKGKGGPILTCTGRHLRKVQNLKELESCTIGERSTKLECLPLFHLLGTQARCEAVA